MTSFDDIISSCTKVSLHVCGSLVHRGPSDQQVFIVTGFILQKVHQSSSINMSSHLFSFLILSITPQVKEGVNHYVTDV